MELRSKDRFASFGKSPRKGLPAVGAATAGSDAVGPGWLWAAAAGSGLRLMMLVMEEEAERLVGPRHQQDESRSGYRLGQRSRLLCGQLNRQLSDDWP